MASDGEGMGLDSGDGIGGAVVGAAAARGAVVADTGDAGGRGGMAVADVRRAIIATIAETETARQAAIAKAETAARDLAASLDAALAAGAEMRRQWKRLGKPHPSVLMESELVTRLGNRLAAILGSMRGHRVHLGRVRFAGSPHSAGVNWSDAERSALADELQRLAKEQ